MLVRIVGLDGPRWSASPAGRIKHAADRDSVCCAQSAHAHSIQNELDCWLAPGPPAYWKSISSTSKRSVALGGMTPPAPREP